MLKWFSGEEGEPGSGGPGSPLTAAGGGELPVEEMAERLSQTEQLVTQLKEMIREKDAALRTKDDQMKVEKEECEAKLTKLRLQNKAKVTSLTTQLEDLRKQQGGQGTPTHSKKKGLSEGGEQASRGKIVLLKKKVEELEQQLSQKNHELENKLKEVESQRQRGEEIDAMLIEKDKKLAEKEAYIVHLQTALAGDQPIAPTLQQKVAEDSGAMQELQLLVQSLTRKVGEAEERYSLLQEQAESLKELLATEKEQYAQKETMYKQNIQTFKDIIIQKDNQLTEISQMHEQELFKLAAKSDASADLEQLLKALKQKLHEKEEVLLGKTQVIDVLQGEVDGRDQQIKELTERLRRIQVERESLESKMEAEKHVMRAQLRDLMEKQQAEVQRMTEQHQLQLDQTKQDLLVQLEELKRAPVAAPPACQETLGSGSVPADSALNQRIAELEAQAQQKTDEASRSEAKFLKMKAWSKSRIRQLEDELKKSQAGAAPPDLTDLRNRITSLEEEREENLWKVEQYEELQTKNEMLEAKLVVYEEQQRTLQADLEQFAKRTASQASESGSADDTQSQVLEWQEMVAEAVSARDRAREEKANMALRISQMEEEREALATQQQELEEELAQARGLSQHRAKKLTAPAQRSLQEDFEFDGQVPFQDPRSTSESTTPMEGENMGDGLRSVVDELELERNQLQEQILSLEERCQDLEDRLQLQARIETLQTESEKLHSQLAGVRSQQSRDAEKHQLLVSSLNEQLKGLSDTQECLESSLIEKENTLAKTSEKLELISSLRESLSEREIQYKDVSEKLLQAEHALENVSKKFSSSEKQCSDLKAEVSNLTQKLTGLKEKTQKQDVTIETLQTELDQTNEELDKLNSAHLEERAQLIHDLQTCEREIDSLKDMVLEKDKEISVLSGNMAEYAEQILVLKQDIKLKEENLVQVETSLMKAEQEAMIIRDSQNSDQQVLNSKITELVEKLKDTEVELVKAKEKAEYKDNELEQLIKQLEDDKQIIQELQGEIQKQAGSHSHHLFECETHITSLKEQLMLSTQKLQESEQLVLQLSDKNTSNEKLQQELNDKEQTYENELKSFKEEHNKLLAQVEKYNNEMQTLSKQLEQAQSEEHIHREMQKKVEALENQLFASNKHAEDERQKLNSELQVQDSENQKLSNELKNKSENLSRLKNLLKSTKAEKQQVTGELELQKQAVMELNEKVTSALELNSCLESQVQSLTKEKERLKEEVSESVQNKDSLQAKIFMLETQHSQNDTFIKGLQRDNEHLTLQISELNRVLEQSTHSTSEVLLAKTNECSHLNHILRQKEDEVKQLQDRVQNLMSEVDLIKLDGAEKEQATADLRIQLEAEQNQRTQLQETVFLLREQESSLRSGLVEKDAILKENQEECFGLQDEISVQKNVVSKLQAEAESLKEELTKIRQQLQERDEMIKDTTQQCQKHKDELIHTTKTVDTQRDHISVMEENTRKLKSEAERWQTELTHSNSRIQMLSEEIQQHRAACEAREQELAQQTHLASHLDSQLKATLEQNSNLSEKIITLTEDNERLNKELSQNTRSVSELTTENSSLQERNSGLEIQILNSQKEISSLLKENEELAAAEKELKHVLRESEQLNSAGLLEKTNECINLSETIREKDKQLQGIQEQVEGLKMQISQLNKSSNEKEQALSEQRLQLETQQNQLLQLQDSESALREQSSALKSGLMEKDSLLLQQIEESQVYQNDAVLNKELVSQLQEEVQLLRQERLDVKQQMEQKEQALIKVSKEFQSQKDELNIRNETVISLSSQLGAMNESAAQMETEITNLKDVVQKLTAEKSQLVQEDNQRKAQVTDFEDSILALKEQNTRLKSELQSTVTSLSKTQEEVTELRKYISDKEIQLKTAYSDLDNLNLALNEKDESLNQKETLMQQLNGNIAEQEEQLKQKADDNVHLKAKVLDLEDCVCKLTTQVENLTADSSTLKNTLESKEQSNLEFQSHSSATVENLKSNVQYKEAECENLKEQISHLKESVTKLNGSLETQMAESENLKKVLMEKEAAFLHQSDILKDVQRRADEALLFKSQFMESTELVSQLQNHNGLLSTELESLRKSSEETNIAFNNLKEKYAANLEELQDKRSQLSHQVDEISNLQKLLDDSIIERQTATSTMETVKKELSVLHHKLEQSEELNFSLAKEKDETFSANQSSVSMLTLEIDRLKSQHLQVVAQMNALTENLEQREMALHAINNQYTAQAKHASQLVSEMQKLEEKNQQLNKEIGLSKVEHQNHLTSVCNDNSHLQEEVRKLLAEKEELERKHQQLWKSQGELQLRMEQQSTEMKEIVEKLELEKEKLQAKVSAKDEELCQLTESIQKIEQILQDSEKEWLLVLDREKQDKNLLAEQLTSVENEIKSKDVKVNALKHDLDSLQAKLEEALSTVRQGSDQLSAKEQEASSSRIQLETVLASIQEKDEENNKLLLALTSVEYELEKLLARKFGPGKEFSLPPRTSSERSAALNERQASLKHMIEQLEDGHQFEVKALKNQLNETQNERGKSNEENGQQIAILKNTVEHLQVQLNAESEKLNAAVITHSSLQSELQEKDDQINCMAIQISQQKELLAGLSQQIRDKDVSIAQVIESASNERVTLGEEKLALVAQLENVEQAQKRLEEICLQLEDQISHSQSEIDCINNEKLELLKGNDELKGELGKVSKEKDAMKKKLQAALVVRKDLLKKLEEYENHKEDGLNDKTQIALLRDQLQEMRNDAQAQAKNHQEKVSLLERAILEKQGEIVELKADGDKLVDQLQSEKQLLQITLNQKEASLSEKLQTISEKTSLIVQLQSSVAEKEKTSEQEINGLMQKIEELQNEIRICQEELKNTSSSAINLENELAQMKSEKAILQKKAQAALLARKETIKKAQDSEKKLTQELAELKDDYKALLEQRCQQTNELNALQLNFDEKVRELEALQKTSLFYLDELETLRQLVLERDKTVQDLKMSLAEKESQCHSLPQLQAELETVRFQAEKMSLKMASKDEALVVMEQKTEALKLKLHTVQNDLEKAFERIQEQVEEIEKYKLKANEEENQQGERILCLENPVLETAFRSSLEEQLRTNEEKCNLLMEENKTVLEQHNQMKVELETALALVSQKSMDVITIEKTLVDMQQQFSDDKDTLTEKLDKAKRSFDLLTQEKENASKVVADLREEVSVLNKQLRKAETLQKKMADNLEVKLKERDDAVLAFEAKFAEKEELIAALELQLKQQTKQYEITTEKMRVEFDDLRRSQEDTNKLNNQDGQNKVALLTRKLQAALVSRKDLLKENETLKEKVQSLSSRHQTKEEEYLDLESSFLKLKQQHIQLESSVSSLNQEKHKVSTELDRISTDNGSLAAACESLKVTIENITQQKQAFSCQLESLKDSQTEELSRWKSKHSDLKQDYESLLQAYENVSSEMDKMRQLLEGAKRDRQEALRRAHKQETEMEVVEKKAIELEEENERIKEKMRKFSKQKQQRFEELEEENKKIRLEMTKDEENHKTAMWELRDRNKQLDSEICQAKESSETLKVKLELMMAENSQLARMLEEVSSSSEKKHAESNTYTSNMQLKLDEALTLNNSLTAQIEAQKTELGAQLEIKNVWQKDKQTLSERIEMIQSDHELQMGKKDDVIKELRDTINQHSQEKISLNEKVRILEDDKSLLQEELENVQEISDKVKNENEYLETVILKNSEKIDELTESVNDLQTQNTQLSSQLTASKERSDQVRQEKEEEQLKLVREFEEKLKMVQRGNQGSKNVKKELQELLKEKHQEINQLQQNCINYQELILDLESSLKNLHSAHEHLEIELQKRSEKIRLLEEKKKQVEAELMTQKNLLHEATEKVLTVESERDQLTLEMQRKQSEDQVTEKTMSLQNNDERQISSYVENQTVLEQQIDKLKDLKDKESEKVNELRRHIDSQDLQINTLKREAETNEAKLSTLLSTPQGAEAAKLWNSLYQKTLNEKDNQLLEQGFVIKRFLEDMRVKDKEVNELRVTKSRLERTLNEYSVAAAAQQRQLFVMSASNAELHESMDLLTVQVKELSAQVEQIEQEKHELSRQLTDKNEIISQIQLNLQQVEKINRDTDTQLLFLRTQNGKYQADLEKQEGISLHLKTLLSSKDAEISSLLSCKDGQMSGYLEQLQANYRSQVAVYEERLTSLCNQREKADKELRGLEAKVRNLQIKVDRSDQEKEQMVAKMESFKNSVVSLQSERERLMSEHRILKAKSELGLKGKESSSDGEGGASKGLKHEIRKLLHQMDDLNSENAMLRAQLVRYREDLNQVLSLKDNQLKVLLKKQQDVIKNLENQKAVAEKQHRVSHLELQKEEEAKELLKVEISKLKAQVSKLEAEMSDQKKFRTTTDVGKVIGDLQEAVAAKAAECNDLHQKVLSQKILIDELNEKMRQVENETDKKLAEAEDKYNSELDTFEHQVDLMRTEKETATQRVAELANDLLEMEQQLSEGKNLNKDIKAQNESLCKSMAALQNDRDQLIEDFKILRNRYDEELRETRAALNKVERHLQDATSDLTMFAKERDILVHQLKAFESKNAHAELNKLLDELSKALLEKEKQLKQVILENNTYSRQLSAFSRSMASLQNDRDRLIDELAGTKRGSSPMTKESGVSALQSETDGLNMNDQMNYRKLPEEISRSLEKVEHLGSERERKDTSPGKQESFAVEDQSGTDAVVSRLEAEKVRLHGDLQRCVYEIQQRDQYYQQLNTKLQQAVEEKGVCAAQLRAVSQTLRDTQNRCHWLESQVQSQTQGSVYAEVAPGAPQERSRESVVLETAEVGQLRDRLLEVEQSLADERARRETAEEALRHAEDRAKSLSDASRANENDFSIDMETEEGWGALSLDPNQPLITRQVKGGMVACRRWLRGRSLYFSKLLTSRTRSRYLFLAYLLSIHVLVLMCLTGAL